MSKLACPFISIRNGGKSNGKKQRRARAPSAKKTVTRNGKALTYWRPGFTTGRDPGTGKQLSAPFTGKTQKEVREKMQAAAVEITQGTIPPQAKMSVGQWLDILGAGLPGAV